MDDHQPDNQQVAPIDGTDEARAIAAAAREAAKRKHDEVVKPEEPQALGKRSKKQQKRTATSTHTVAVPEGYEGDAQQRDPAVYGGCTSKAFQEYGASPIPFAC